MQMKRWVYGTVVMVFLMKSITVCAQEEILDWLDPNQAPYNVQANYYGTFYGDEDVSNQATDLGIFEHDFTLTVPLVWDDTYLLGLSGDFLYQDIDTRAIFPDNGNAFPNDLYDLNVSVNYIQNLENDWVFGGIFTTGSASDEPFHSIDEVEFEVNAFLRIPHVDNNHWVFLVNYSNNREFLNNIPIPGVGYWYEPSDRLQVVAGIPFLAVRAKPYDPITIRLVYYPTRNIDSEIAYSLTDSLDLFTGFAWENQRYLLAGRADNDDRLFYYEKKVSGGVRYALHKKVDIKLEGGYSFDRFYFIGEDYDDRHKNRIDIDDGPFGSIQVSFRY